MTIRPINGAKPTPVDCYALAVALKKFGYLAHVTAEEANDGYQRCVEAMTPVQFGIEKAAPRAGTSEDGMVK